MRAVGGRALCLGAGIAALALAACGAARPTRPPPSAVACAEQTHEYPSPASHAPTAIAGAPSAAAAVAAFAGAYINWTAATVSGDMRSLAGRSVGQARAAMALAAAQTASDYELRHGGIANSGTVEVVAAVRGARYRFVVVTRETTTATGTAAYQGLLPAWHVTVATVSRQGLGQWVVSGWQPES